MKEGTHVVPLNWPGPAQIANPWDRLSLKIGRFLLAFGNAEQQIDGDPWQITHIASDTKALPSQFVERLARWQTELLVWDPAIAANLTDLVADLTVLNDIRNDLAHGVRSVVQMHDTGDCFVRVVRQDRNYARSFARWTSQPAASRGPQPEAFTSRNIPEVTLDGAAVAMEISTNLVRDLPATARWNWRTAHFPYLVSAPPQSYG